MIRLGLDAAQKDAAVTAYCRAHGIRRVYVFGPALHRFACTAPDHEHVDWPDVIRYVFYYRLLKDIDAHALLVFNEILQTQDRHALTYNCLRSYARQTPHVLAFSTLPLIDTADDAMILLDLVTRDRYRRVPFDTSLFAGHVSGPGLVPSICAQTVMVDDATHAKYATEREARFSELGARDPHTVPRDLHMLGGRARLDAVPADRAVVMRNRRLAKRRPIATFDDDALPDAPYVLADVPHRFLDLAMFVARTRPAGIEVIVTDLKVDQWYLARVADWTRRIADVCASILPT